MAKLEDINVKIKAANISVINDLLTVLTDNIDELPSELKSKVLEVVNAEDFSVIDVDYLISNGFELPAHGYSDGVEIEHVISVNKVLGHVKYANTENNIIHHSKPDNFKLIDANNVVVIEW